MRGHEHKLLLVQIDDVSGEIIGDVINTLMSTGAANVHVISTVTKKNRAGHILLIDCPEQRSEEIGQYLQNEISVGGYHILDSSHVAVKSELVTRNVEIKSERGTLKGEIIARMMNREGCTYTLKLEHSSVIDLKQRINSELGIDIATMRLKDMLNNLLREEMEDIISIRLV